MNNTRNILVITYWKFSDALVQTYTLPYLRIIRDILPAGSKIILVTLEDQENHVVRHEESEPSISHVSFQLLPFGPKAIFGWRRNLRVLAALVKNESISTIHTWCTPAGTIGYLLSRKTGIPLVLDSYEPHAEPMVETGTWTRFGLAFRTLFHYEKKQSHHAKWRIGVVDKMREYAKVKYNCTTDNFLVKPACVDLDLFKPQKNRRELRAQLGYADDDVVCICAGKFGGLYLELPAFRVFKGMQEAFKENFQVLLLTSTPRAQIESYCKEAGLDPEIVHSVFVPHNWVPNYMSAADFAFSPFKPVPSRRYCTPIKNGEYWAVGLPIVIPEGISDDSAIISSTNAGQVMPTLSQEDAIKAGLLIRKMLHDQNREELTARIRSLAEKHRNFTIAKEVYQTIYGRT